MANLSRYKLSLISLLLPLLQACYPHSPKIFQPPNIISKVTGISCDSVAGFNESGIYQNCSPGAPNSCAFSALSDRNIGSRSTFDLLPPDVPFFSVTGGNQVTDAFFCRFEGRRQTLTGPLILGTTKPIPVPGGSSRVVAVYKHDADRFSAAVFNIQSINLGQQLSVTLQWGAGARDLELHLIQKGGIINNNNNPNWVAANGTFDCTWTSCVRQVLDWFPFGSPLGNATKDVDFIPDNGIENIFVTAPAATTYNVYVEYWASGIPANPTVSVTYAGVTLFQGSISNFLPQHVWMVGTFDQVNQKFTPSGQIIDCRSNWASGCRMPLF